MRVGQYLAVACVVLASVAAKADSSIGTPPLSDFYGSATLTTTDSGLITAITPGSGFGAGVTALVPVGQFNNGTGGNNTGQPNDNMLYPTSTTQVVDLNGFAFTANAGDTNFEVDVYSPSANTYDAYVLDSDGFAQTVPITLTVGPATGDPMYTVTFAAAAPAPSTPEPSSLALLGTGVLGLGAFVRGRKRAVKSFARG